jgi:hypothetical protein
VFTARYVLPTQCICVDLRTNSDFDMCYTVHFRKVFIDTSTNAPLVYYTIINLHVSTLLGHHQGFT